MSVLEQITWHKVRRRQLLEKNKCFTRVYHRATCGLAETYHFFTPAIDWTRMGGRFITDNTHTHTVLVGLTACSIISTPGLYEP